MTKGKTNPFELDFDSYILQSEPEKQENGKLWQTAIGLQQVDGLTPSKYLYETAKRNIDGEITIEEVGEGNTRTTAVFTIKYLTSLGFEVNNEPFEKNSWYFRNALVRANYTNMNKGIYMNTEYLEKFFCNLLLDESNELKNRYCHIKYNAKSTNKVTPKVTVNVTVKLTVNQKKILEEVKKNPFVTQEELAEIISITRKSINENMKKLQSQKIIERIGADKNGYWKIIEK